MLFLLFHASANLCILLHDDGAAYSAFCHFMNDNIAVKVMEVALLGTLALHIALTIYLYFTNKTCRPVGYHVPSKTKTAKGSKLMVLTGILIFAFLGLHFYNFYLVKIGWVEGRYLVDGKALTEKVEDYIQIKDYIESMGGEMEDFLEEIALYDDDSTIATVNEFNRDKKLSEIIDDAKEKGHILEEENLIRINKEEKALIAEAVPEAKIEPDFYTMARQLFGHGIASLLYLAFFAILWLHLRHAFESAFQTLGLNNYKYSRAIEIVGLAFATVVCVAFAAVPIGVMLGL